MYATPDDMISAVGADNYGKLTDPSYYNPDNPDVSRGLDALQRASDEIDGYLCRQYALPLAEVPPFLRTVCCDIAYYRLFFGEGAPDGVIARYDKAVKWLRDVAEGKVGLGLSGDYKVPVREERRISSVALTL